MKRNAILLLVFSLSGASVQLFAQPDQRLQEPPKVITIQIDGDDLRLNGKSMNIDSSSGLSKKRSRIFLNDEAFVMEDQGRNDFSTQKKNWEKTETVTFLGVMTEPVEKGLKITDVSKNSPAEKAGLQVGDVIMKVDDEKMEDAEGLQKFVRGKQPGDEVRMQIKRGGKKQQINATLGMKKEVRRQVMVLSGDMNDSRLKLNDLLNEVEEGVGANADRFVDRMLDLGDDLKDMDVRIIKGNSKPKLGLKIQDTEQEKGVRILQVTTGSVAEKSGLKAEDLLLEIDGNAIKNTDEARSQLQASEEKQAYPVVVERNGARVNIEIKNPKPLKTTDL